MTIGTRKKIYFYRHEMNETIIDIYDAQEWDDFLIVKVGNSLAPVTQEMIDQVSDVLDKMNTEKYSQIIVMPADLDIDFYGIEVEDE